MLHLGDGFQSTVLAKIRELNSGHFDTVVIDCNFNKIKYKLILLTSECADNERLMDLIGKWRKENEKWFFSQFEVTTERTTKWFKEKVIETPGRMLFIIKADNEYIGHVGLFRFDFETRTCEIDNIVRGESKYPGIMGNAIMNMMDWGRINLGLVNYSLKTTSDNEKAIRLYNRLGFKETARIPLIQVEGKDGQEWTEAPEGYDRETFRYYIVMRTSYLYE